MKAPGFYSISFGSCLVFLGICCFTLYYVDHIFVTDNNSNTIKVPSYLKLDSSIKYQYSKTLNFELVGQNLLGNQFHQLAPEMSAV